MSKDDKKPLDPRVIVVMTPEFITRIDDFRYAERIPSRSEAIRIALEEFLDHYEARKSKDTPNES